MMKSPIIKRSIVIKRHKTSVSLEDAFWHDLKLMAAEENKSLSALQGLVRDDLVSRVAHVRRGVQQVFGKSLRFTKQ